MVHYLRETESPIETFKSGGKVISLSNWCKKGIGLKDYKLTLEDINDTHYDFVCGFPVLTRTDKKQLIFKSVVICKVGIHEVY